ncbi:MAG: hypothetical protein JJE25_05235 [Bacteroidia bacterium]|nr:hypothetical protein [Bacteroidia bacterium]
MANVTIRTWLSNFTGLLIPLPESGEHGWKVIIGYFLFLIIMSYILF